jgi:hypothetical protein
MYRHIGLLALFAAAAFGQQGFGFVAGAPYSAEQVDENVQTLADGTHITQKSTTKIYRDSAGRTRTERTISTPGRAAEKRISIEIVDYVANVRYTLDPQEKLAHKTAMAAPGNRPAFRRSPDARVAKPTQVQDPDRPEKKTEFLESTTMEGLAVEGERYTTTWQAGSRMGNDRPITTVREAWTSQDLKIKVLDKYSDPLTGERTGKLVNISRAEPDPSLFQVPADYTVTEEDRRAPR